METSTDQVPIMRNRRIIICGMMMSIVTGSVLAAEPTPASQPAPKSPSLPHRIKPAAKEQFHPAVDPNLAILARLQKPVERISFDQEPFEEVVAWFRDQGLTNFYVHWGYLEENALVERSSPVTLELSEATLGEVLDQVLENLSAEAAFPEDRLTYQIRRGILHVSARRDFNQEVVVRTYYVEDMLRKLVFFDDAPEISLAGGGLGGNIGSGSGGGSGGGGGTGGSGRGGGSSGGSSGGSAGGSAGGGGGGGGELIDHEGDRTAELAKLLAVIQQIRPESWRENGGWGTVVEYQGKLIISQTVEIHEIIGGRFRERAELP